ncbi:MAG: site-specific DNA-methyltransferase, partial [Candidatus Thorarchaeota archaeon]|nr:site-specific DNA-methyltransferase [Candidatus Thorarchaeota archaeon]
KSSAFLSKWFTARQLGEMSHYLSHIQSEDDPRTQNAMRIILSRTVRSSRATKHVDLATLVDPQTEPYYCSKHYKICTPIQTIIPHLRRYSKDTVKRLDTFSKLREEVHSEVINGDSTKVNILAQVKKQNPAFHKVLQKKKIDGVLTSPPYLGLIDYHEQHAYAYELFDIERKDDFEIGRMSNGSSLKAQQDYIQGISDVFLNIQKYMKPDADIFVVANDKFNLYPTIAELSNLDIKYEYKRPVLNRTERDKQPYSESIFHLVLQE